jgi:hypothetical protein
MDNPSPETQNQAKDTASEGEFLPRPFPRQRVRIGLLTTLVGFLLLLVGARPGLFHLDRSPVIGWLQIGVFLVGLALICLGGYLSLASLWRQQPPSIAADIGLRLVSTGYVISIFCGMADIFGFGSQTMPAFYFGPLQALGVQVGEFVIAIGFLLLIPYPQPKH